MMETKGHCSQIDSDDFKIRSQTNPEKFYVVSKTENGLICQCKDHTCRKSDCKHIKIVLEIIKQNKCYRNNIFRMLNETIRDREVSYRGIKKMDSPLFDGFQTFYNFSKKHGGIDGRTPAEMAKIEVDGSNKWKTIIQNASLHGENSV